MAPDKDELLPFCMRCFGIGASCDEHSNFCHQCGSEGTCIPLKREDVYYIKKNITKKINSVYETLLDRYGE